MRIRPAARNKSGVPAQQRPRTDTEDRPGVARQRPAERREQDPVDGSVLRLARLPAQDRELVP
jgi:hypothetical protein